MLYLKQEKLKIRQNELIVDQVILIPISTFLSIRNMLFMSGITIMSFL